MSVDKIKKYDSGYQKSQDVIASEQKKNEATDAVTNYEDFAYSKVTPYNDIIDKINNREKFSYDLNGDALYQQYKDKYIQQGKMAMQDAMGQAAAMTGGYGNSYAASVGNQAYQASLGNLNDVIPELYQLAYDKYRQEGQDLYNQYAMLSDDRNMEYGMWGDKYNRLVADRDYYTNEANNAYSKDRDAFEDEQWQKSFDEGVRQFDKGQELQDEKWVWEKAQNEAKSTGGVVKVDENGKPIVVQNPEYTFGETDQTKMFKASIKTKNEFYTRGGADKEKYGSYEKYIEGIMDKWLSEGKLTESEVATLIAHYRL